MNLLIYALSLGHSRRIDDEPFIRTKSLSVTFIISTLLLSYISVAFQSSLVHFSPFGPFWSTSVHFGQF